MDTLLFLWEKLKVFMQNEQMDASEFTQKIDNPEQVSFKRILLQTAN